MWPKPIYKASQSLSIQPYNFRASDQQIIIFGYKLIIYFVEIHDFGQVNVSDQK